MGVDVGSVEPVLRRKFGYLRDHVLIAVVADESIKLTTEVICTTV